MSISRRAALGSSVATLVEQADIDSYIAEAQPYIRQAIEDVSSVSGRDLQQVAEIIVNRAWEDELYPQIAAALCAYLCKKEVESQALCSIPNYKFRNSVIDKCTSLMDNYEHMRTCSMSYWLAYLRLIIELYLQMRPKDMTLLGIGNLLFQAMSIITSQPCVQNFDEVELMCSIWYECGQDLQNDNRNRLISIVNRLRDVFLDGEVDQSIQCLILPLIELYASNWQFSDSAKEFYMNSC